MSQRHGGAGLDEKSSVRKGWGVLGRARVGLEEAARVEDRQNRACRRLVVEGGHWTFAVFLGCECMWYPAWQVMCRMEGFKNHGAVMQGTSPSGPSGPTRACQWPVAARGRPWQAVGRGGRPRQRAQLRDGGWHPERQVMVQEPGVWATRRAGLAPCWSQAEGVRRQALCSRTERNGRDRDCSSQRVWWSPAFPARQSLGCSMRATE